MNITNLICDKYCFIYAMVDVASNPKPTYYEIRTNYLTPPNLNPNSTLTNVTF